MLIMAIRLKWQLSGKEENFYDANDTNKACKQSILDLLDHNALTVHFQPIYSSIDGKVFGYEALTRIKGEHPFEDISELFRKAILTNTISTLDVHCRGNAINQASALGLNTKEAHLFINICPDTMMDTAHRVGITDELLERSGIP